NTGTWSPETINTAATWTTAMTTAAIREPSPTSSMSPQANSAIPTRIWVFRDTPEISSSPEYSPTSILIHPWGMKMAASPSRRIRDAREGLGVSKVGSIDGPPSERGPVQTAYAGRRDAGPTESNQEVACAGTAGASHTEHDGKRPGPRRGGHPRGNGRR